MSRTQDPYGVTNVSSHTITIAVNGILSRILIGRATPAQDSTKEDDTRVGDETNWPLNYALLTISS